MFKKRQDKELDITSLNEIIRTGKNLVNIIFFMSIVSLVLIATYLIKEWHILKYVGDLITVISPIFIGFLLAWLCVPAANFLQEKKIPRVFACIIVYVVLLLFLVLLGWALIPSLASQISDFAKSLPDIMEELTDFSNNILKSLDNSIFSSKDIQANVFKSLSDFATSFTTELPQRLFSMGKVLISGGLNVVLGLMIGFYLLFDFDKVNEAIHNTLPISWRDGYKDLCTRINSSLRSYVQGLLLVMFLVFITQSIGLTIAGLKAPLLFALFCAITDVIPYFGPYIGAIPAIIVGFAMSPIVGICVVISIVVVQLLENNFYQPLIMGHTMKLHPVTIMVGLLVFQHFFGIIGMIIATPTIACLKVIFTFINEKVNLKEKVTGEE